MIRQLPRVALLLALGYAMLPLLEPHALAGHSAPSDWVRAEAIHAAVEGGDTFPAWLPDLYYRHGSPLPLYYAPLSYAVVEAIRQLGGEPALALELALFLFWAAGAVGAALAGRALAGPGAGCAAAAAFALSPYWLVDVYVRGGLGELAGFALLPWAFALLLRPGGASAALGALAVAALPLSHNVTALLALPALVALALAGGPEERRRRMAILAAGLSLAAFFWLPALAGTDLVQARESLTSGPFDAARNLLSPRALLPGGGGFEVAVGPRENVRFGLGALLWGALAASPWLARGRDRATRRAAVTFAVLALAALFAMTSPAAALWRSLPLLAYAQFPFRLLLVATACVAPLVGLAVARAPERLRPLAATLVIALAALAGRSHVAPRYLFLDRATGEPRPVAAADLARAADDPALARPGEYFTLERLRRSPWTGTVGHDYLPRTVERLPSTAPQDAAQPLADGVTVLASRWSYPGVEAEIAVERPAELALAQFQFPGWRVEVDGRERASRTEVATGRIVVPVEAGDRRVVARFGPTPLRRWALAASCIAAIALAWATARCYRGSVHGERQFRTRPTA